MSRNLESTLEAGLSDAVIAPVRLCELKLKSGTVRVWNGPGPLSWNGETWDGVGKLGQVGPVSEATEVMAGGTTVSLSGIALSGIPALPPGITPPTLTPPAGQSVVWSLATLAPVTDVFTSPPNIWNGGLGNSGIASGTLTSGVLGLTNGASLGSNSVALAWRGFARPADLPADARVVKVIPVAAIGAGTPGGFETLQSSAGSGGMGGGNWGLASLSTGADVGTWDGVTLGAYIQNTLGDGTNISLAVDFIGLAVYFEGSPLPSRPILREALEDIAVGGSARLWKGLYDIGAGGLKGTPYQYFRGYVDKVTANLSGESAMVTLALEARMSQLGRASFRRYTAADQALQFSGDSGFDWIEQLQDIALKTGT